MPRLPALRGGSPIKKRAKHNSQGERRFCVLETGNAFEKGDYAQAFVDFFSEEGEQWEVYDLRADHWPAEDDEDFVAYVVTGSWADAYESDPWIVRLRAFLKSLHERKRRIFAGCFGHQVLAHALPGGLCQPSTTGWEIGVVDCQATEALTKKWYSESGGAPFPSSFKVHQSHYDQVVALPEGAELLAFSATTPIEAFSIGDHILCMQGHPEWGDEITKKLLDLRIEKGHLSEDAAATMNATLGTQTKEDLAALTNLCKRFLKDEVRLPVDWSMNFNGRRRSFSAVETLGADMIFTFGTQTTEDLSDPTNPDNSTGFLKDEVPWTGDRPAIRGRRRSCVF